MAAAGDEIIVHNELGNGFGDAAGKNVSLVDVEAAEHDDTLLFNLTGPFGGSDSSFAEAEDLFSWDEYKRYSVRNRKVEFKGFAFLQVEELDYMYKDWPDTATFSSTQPHFLRGLAVTYFYQSQMAKARELLLRIWESDDGDVDVALMLAECACALPTIECETFNVAYNRLRDCTNGSLPFTWKHVEQWEKRLKKNGRFMGYILLQLALYDKRIESYRVNNRKHLTYSCIRKIAQTLHGFVNNKVMEASPQLTHVLFYLFDTLKDDVDDFRFIVLSPNQQYVTAFINNCIAYLNNCSGNHRDGLSSSALGLNILEYNYKYDADRRILKGDLHMNRGAALFKIGQYGEAKKDFKNALRIYQNCSEGRQHPAVKSRAVALATLASDRTLALHNAVLGNCSIHSEIARDTVSA